MRKSEKRLFAAEELQEEIVLDQTVAENGRAMKRIRCGHTQQAMNEFGECLSARRIPL